jgi:lantibiotic modifying enzyme
VPLAAVAGIRHGVAGARALAGHAAGVLLAEAEPALGGLRWRFVPERFRTTPATEMPNWSHGTAGVAAALALAGAELGRPDLVAAATAGAEHLVTLAVPTAGGVVLPRYSPEPMAGEEPYSFGWCHGAAGTSQLFAALERAGVPTVAGQAPSVWRRRLLTAVVSSGVPERLRPGFWDNDGRCCGTAGVGEVFLDAWEHGGDERDLAFARRLGDALVARAVRDEAGARWRFLALEREEPLLPPGVGWMQGTAGIAAYLLRLARATGTPAPNA